MEKYLNTQQVKDLGFTDADIKNAQPYESTTVRQEGLVKDFNAEEKFNVTNGILYYAETIINYKGLEIKISKTTNYKGQIFIYMAKTTDLVSPKDIPHFTDNDIYKYSKNKVQKRLDFVYDNFVRLREKEKQSKNFLDAKRQEMENKGFKFYSDTQAFFKNDNVSIEIEIYNAGIIVKRLSNTKISTDTYIDKLISM